MKRSYFLTALLSISVVVNLIFVANYFYYSKDYFFIHHNFGDQDPFPVARDTAQMFHHKYVTKYRIPLDSVRGGVFPRSVFEKIVNSGCNAVAYSLSVNSIDSNGPNNEAIFIVIAGAQVTYKEDGSIETLVTPANAIYYRPRNWCPPNCMLNW